jgi:hypothetical protein
MVERSDLGFLSEDVQGPFVSLYMPTHNRAKDTHKNPIRFKNLLREAYNRLLKLGFKPNDAKGMLQPGLELVEDEYFWRKQLGGLAVFIGDGFFRLFNEPSSFVEIVVVEPQFYVLPLLSLVGGNGSFFVLALSQKQIRILHNRKGQVQEVEVDSVPRSLTEAIGLEEPDSQIQVHSAAPRGVSGKSAQFHGQGAGTDDAKDRIQRFFQLVDSGLKPVLGGKTAPLVLAGVDYLFPIYRKVNTYPYLLDEGIPGSPDGLDDQLLAEKAQELLQPHFERPFQDAVAKFGNLSGTGLVATGLEDALPAADQGRVETLIIAPGGKTWGAFKPESASVQIHERQSPGDLELENLCALKVLANGGTVFATDSDDIPGDGDLAAIYRY